MKVNLNCFNLFDVLFSLYMLKEEKLDTLQNMMDAMGLLNKAIDKLSVDNNTQLKEIAIQLSRINSNMLIPNSEKLIAELKEQSNINS